MALPAIADIDKRDVSGDSAASQAPSELFHKVLDAAGIRALDVAGWEELSAKAMVENPFYARQYVLAGLATIDKDADIQALAISTGDGQLVGLFPFHTWSKVPSPFRTANAAANAYQFNGTPLVHRDHAGAVIGYWLDQIKGGKLRPLWTFVDLDMETPLAELILDGVVSRHMSTATVNDYERAYLTRLEGGFEAHLNQVLSKNRLKDVRRTTRRLQEVGKITLEHVTEPEAVRARLEDFLALEHAGWKGEKGTSLLSNEDDAAFARLAYDSSEASRGFVAFDSLLLDGKPIAMKLSVRTGETAFTPKIAYDEAHKKLGPGMALEYALIEDFYNNPVLGGVDAAATAEGHSALNFFNNQKHMATLIVGASGWQVKALTSLYKAREWARRKVKQLLKMS